MLSLKVIRFGNGIKCDNITPIFIIANICDYVIKNQI